MVNFVCDIHSTRICFCGVQTVECFFELRWHCGGILESSLFTYLEQGECFRFSAARSSSASSILARWLGKKNTWPPYQSYVGFYTIAQPKMVPSFSLTFIDLVFHSTGLTAVQSVKYLWILCSSDNLYFNWLDHWSFDHWILNFRLTYHLNWVIEGL